MSRVTEMALGHLSAMPKVPARLLLRFLILAILISVAGFFYYLYDQRQSREQSQDDLAAIADLKVNRLAAWRKERLADANALAGNRVLAGMIRQYLARPEDQALARAITDWLALVRTSHEYAAVSLVDGTGRTRLSVPAAPREVEPGHIAGVQEALRKGSVSVVDFHRYGGKIHLAFLAPFSSGGPEAARSGVTILHVEAKEFLYPYIQTWPVPSPTAETLLVRREGDSVVFLTDLRHRKDVALSLRLPISNPTLPSAAALRGREGVFEGVDYRGVKVLSVLRHVPESEWALITKVDQEEIYAPIRRRAWGTLGVVVLVTALSAMSVGLLWVQRESRFYRHRYEAERERRALAGRYESLMRSANDIVLVVDDNGSVLEANERALSTYGYTAEEMLDLNVRDLYPAPQGAEAERLWRSGESAEGLLYESVHLRKDGSSLPVEVSSRAIAVDGKRLRLKIVRDVTEHKRAEAELRKANRGLRLLSECNQALIRAADEQDLLDRLCRMAVDIGGYRLAWVGIAQDDEEKSVRPVARAGHEAEYVDSLQVTWAEAPRGLGPTGTATRTGKPVIVRDAATHPDLAPWREQALRRGYASAIALPLSVEGRVIGALSIYASEPDAFDESEVDLLTELAGDLSFGIQTLRGREEQARTVEALQQSEERFHAAFDQAPMGLEVSDLEGRSRWVNGTFCAMLGYSPEELAGRDFRDIMHPEDVPFTEEAIRGMLHQRGYRSSGERRCLRKDGSVMWAHIVAGALCDASGRPYAFLAHIRDTSEEHQAREALERSQASLAHAQSIASLGSFEVDSLTGEVAWSDETYRIFGLDKESFKPNPVNFLEAIPPDERERIVEAITKLWSTGASWAVEHHIQRPDGTLRFVRAIGEAARDAHGNIIGVIGTLQDITEQRRLEEQFLQAQKLETVGRLAGGIAHDFNNLLTVINGYCDLLLSRVDPSTPIYRPLGDIRKAGERAASLTQQLLAFSRKQIIQPAVLDLNGVAKEVEDMLRRLLGEDVTLEMRLGCSLGRVRADAGQIHQILMNLVVNARDAMPGGGTLVIETADVELDQTYADEHAEVKPGPYVMLAVSDTGTGITEEVKRHIFEPFFTTKTKGEGSGLGLSTVYGLVKQSGGSIWVYSEAGRGTTFKVYLPRVSAEPDRARSDHRPAHDHRGNETVLVVEDLEELRTLTELLLKDSGYKVLAASHGEDALRVAGEYADAIHVLLTDVVMPGMTGRELADRLQTVRPGLKILFMSGYTENVIAHHGVLDEGVALLEKPFTPTGLAEAIRAVLDTPEGPNPG